MKNVAVYKTNVGQSDEAKKLVEMLTEHFPTSDINFDLDDCDKILRVKHDGTISHAVPLLLSEHGFLCEELTE